MRTHLAGTRAVALSCALLWLASCAAEPELPAADGPLILKQRLGPTMTAQAPVDVPSQDPRQPVQLDDPRTPIDVKTSPLMFTCKLPHNAPISADSSLVTLGGWKSEVVAPQLRVAAMTDYKPWRSGHPIGVHGDRVLAVDRLNGTLVEVDAKTLALQHTIPLGGRPHQLVISPNGTAYVTVRDASAVAVIPPGKDATVTWWKVGADPRGLALSGDAKRLYVAVTGSDRVVVLDAVSGQVLTRLLTADRPAAVATSPEGTVVVGFVQGPAQVLQVNATGQLVHLASPALRTDWLSGACFGGFGGKPNGDPGGTTKTEPFRYANRVSAMAIDPETSQTALLHTIVSPGTTQGGLNAAMNAIVDENGNVKGTQNTGYGSGCFGNRPVEPGVTYIEGSKVVTDIMVTPSNAAPWLEGKATQPIQVKQLPPKASQWFDQPTDIAFHPHYRFSLVTGKGSDRVMAVRSPGPDTLNYAEQVVAVWGVGQAPIGVAISADGKTGYVLNAHSLSITTIDLGLVIDPPAKSMKLGKTFMPQVITCAKEELVFAEDPASEAQRKGRRLFTFSQTHDIAANGQFACATCHVEGDEDGMVWHTPEGARQTPRLAGRLKGTHPFNWIGSESELGDNMGKTIQRMGGNGFSKVQLSALEAFLVDGLKAPPTPKEKLDPAQVAEGKALFFDATVGCANCHLGGGGVDGQQHDVGTGSKTEKQIQAILQSKAKMPGGKQCGDVENNPTSCTQIQPVASLKFDTPSLQHVGQTAPYLHDGSATTLKEALLLTKGTMGNIGKLTDAQIDALVAFLKTL